MVPDPDAARDLVHREPSGPRSDAPPRWRRAPPGPGRGPLRRPRRGGTGRLLPGGLRQPPVAVRPARRPRPRWRPRGPRLSSAGGSRASPRCSPLRRPPRWRAATKGLTARRDRGRVARCRRRRRSPALAAAPASYAARTAACRTPGGRRTRPARRSGRLPRAGADGPADDRPGCEPLRSGGCQVLPAPRRTGQADEPAVHPPHVGSADRQGERVSGRRQVFPLVRWGLKDWSRSRLPSSPSRSHEHHPLSAPVSRMGAAFDPSCRRVGSLAWPPDGGRALSDGRGSGEGPGST